jgi:hypothetical protein
MALETEQQIRDAYGATEQLVRTAFVRFFPL